VSPVISQSPEVLSRLDALAAKLGVAANYLWAVLVRQAYVEAVGALLFLVVVHLATRYALRIWRHGRDKGWHQGEYGLPFEMGTAIGMLMLGVCWIVAVVQVVCGVQNVLNPEYFALHQVLDALK